MDAILGVLEKGPQHYRGHCGLSGIFALKRQAPKLISVNVC